MGTNVDKVHLPMTAPIQSWHCCVFHISANTSADLSDADGHDSFSLAPIPSLYLLNHSGATVGELCCTHSLCLTRICSRACLGFGVGSSASSRSSIDWTLLGDERTAPKQQSPAMKAPMKATTLKLEFCERQGFSPCK